MRYYLVFLAMFLVACGGTDLLPDADILVPDVIGSDQSDSDTDLLRRDTPAEDRGQPDEGDDEGTDPGTDEGQDVVDAQEEDVGEDSPAADTSVEDPGADEGEDAQEDAGEDISGDEEVAPDEGSDPGAEDVGTDTVVYGTGNCYDLWTCWINCLDRECRPKCVAKADQEAQESFNAVWDCLHQACDKWGMDAACLNEALNYGGACYDLAQSCLADVD